MLRGKIKYFVPAGIWALAIFVVSSIPDLSTSNIGISFSDKLAHMSVYAVLGFLTAWAFSKFYEDKSRIFKYSWMSAGVYGIFDEIHQYLVPGRYLEFLDMLANILGALLAIGLFLLIKSRKSQIAN